MAETNQYRIAVPETYEKDGEEKTAWTTVGTAFQNEKGSISLKIHANISVSGNVALFPKDDESEEE